MENEKGKGLIARGKKASIHVFWYFLAVKPIIFECLETDLDRRTVC